MKLKDFMKKIGCEKWPERWNELYDKAVMVVDKGDCCNYETKRFYEENRL